MKKIILALVLLAFMASSVLAAPGGRKNGYFEKYPAPVHHQLPPRPHEKFHHKGHNSFGIGLAAGIIGMVIGSYIVDSYYQPVRYSGVQYNFNVKKISEKNELYLNYCRYSLCEEEKYGRYFKID